MCAHLSWHKIDSWTGNFSSPNLITHRPCPVCGSLRFQTILEFNDFQFFSDSDQVPKRILVREVRCLDCFTLYMNPCYSQTGFTVLLDEAGGSYGSSGYAVAERVAWLTAEKLIPAGACVLDVGCHEGGFLADLPGKMRKIGVDINAPAIESGLEKHRGAGLELIAGDIECLQCPAQPDVITMFHVLEHLTRPIEVLRRLRLFGHSETRLVLEVPVLEKGGRHDINGFFSVQHLTHFTRASLNNCFRRAGWWITEELDPDDYYAHRVVAQPCEPDLAGAADQGDFTVLYRYFSAWHAALGAAEKRTVSWPPLDRYVIWGGGLHTEVMYQTLGWFHGGPDRTYLVVDSDPVKHWKTWRGIKIYPPSVLGYVDWESTALVVSSYGSQSAIAAAARRQGVPEDRICTLYDNAGAY